MNDVFILPPKYILNRWTKYAKKGFHIERKTNQNETLKAHAARLSRKATSLALKCSVSRPLLDYLEKALEKLEMESDASLSNLRENDVPMASLSSSRVNDIPMVLNDSNVDIIKSAISFRVPRVIKGAKSKRAKNIVEKKAWKKKKFSQEKGTHHYARQILF
jgi:hypothetical protein